MIWYTQSLKVDKIHETRNWSFTIVQKQQQQQPKKIVEVISERCNNKPLLHNLKIKHEQALFISGIIINCGQFKRLETAKRMVFYWKLRFGKCMLDAKCNSTTYLRDLLMIRREFYGSCVTEERELSDHLSTSKTLTENMNMITKQFTTYGKGLFFFVVLKFSFFFRVKRMQHNIQLDPRLKL